MIRVVHILPILILTSALACGPEERSGHAAPTAAVAGPLALDALANQQTFRVALVWDVTGHTATLTFSRADGTLATIVSDVHVRLWMPEHHHDGLGKPHAQLAAADVAHVWNVHNVAPSMSGDWEFRIEARVDGRLDTAVLPVYVDAKRVGAGSGHAH